MNGNNILLDTNACLYILSDKNKAKILVENTIYISFVTELEILSYPEISEYEQNIILKFISKIEIIDIDQTIKKNTIELRKKYKLKLPDAIISSTALAMNLVLITNDNKLHKITEIKSQSI